MWTCLLLLAACNGPASDDTGDTDADTDTDTDTDTGVEEGDTWSGTLDTGASGDETHEMSVEPDTWHRLRAEAEGDLGVFVYSDMPIEPENLVVQCVDPNCVVDFITPSDASTYYLRVGNYTSDPLAYSVTSETRTIPEITIDGDPHEGVVTGLASVYVRFEGESGRHNIVVQADASIDNPVAWYLYDAQGVYVESEFETFYWTDTTSAASREWTLEDGTYHLKVKNIALLFSVDPDTSVPFAISVSTSAR